MAEPHTLDSSLRHRLGLAFDSLRKGRMVEAKAAGQALLAAQPRNPEVRV
jgi:hypothetical protein